MTEDTDLTTAREIAGTATGARNLVATRPPPCYNGTCRNIMRFGLSRSFRAEITGQSGK